MIIPIRCFTCGKLIADRWETFSQRIQQEGDENTNKILDDIGLKRYCCRRMLISHVPLLKHISEFSQKG
ncbi:MAG: DNA-directed RNA polymerase subunit N [Candidatus Helarchaeota archaeon]|nr:DNA-directed RNA polymerase subunit N [Candidatus Helarchaeota archaeon]